MLITVQQIKRPKAITLKSQVALLPVDLWSGLTLPSDGYFMADQPLSPDMQFVLPEYDYSYRSNSYKTFSNSGDALDLAPRESDLHLFR